MNIGEEKMLANINLQKENKQLQTTLTEANKEIERLKTLLRMCSNVFEILSYKKQTADLRDRIAKALQEKSNENNKRTEAQD
jgi:hypothetical protein